MTGRICHISNHPYDYDAERDGCRCIAKFDDYEMPNTPMFGTVPGGSKDTSEYRFHMDFDKGLNKYKQARDNGLQPKGTTVKAVDAAEAEVASHQRALKKMRKMGDVGEELKIAKGVE